MYCSQTIFYKADEQHQPHDDFGFCVPEACAHGPLDEFASTSREELIKEIHRLREQLSSREDQLTYIREEFCKLLDELGENAAQTAQLEKENPLLRKMEGNDVLTRFYTGLNTHTLFQSTYEHLSEGIETHPQSALSLREHFLLTLMKLRLNLREKDLAVRFNVSLSSVSRYFIKWITIMHVRLVPFVIRWPSKEEIRVSLPRIFRNSQFYETVAIIDCFEIPMNVPSHLLDKVSAFSHYKHEHTAKYMISILPQGATNFISQGYCGRTSDQFIVDHSGFLDQLKEGTLYFRIRISDQIFHIYCYSYVGDLVLADRGFTVAEAVGMRGGKLVTPAFKGRRQQLSKREVHDSRNVAVVRIHVERVIGVIKSRFSIMAGPVNILHASPNGSGENLFDKIVAVCCALNNLNPSVVPFD